MAFTTDERHDLKIKIAHLYYSEDKTQAEIASMLNISRPTIVKLLKEAKKEKIVRIQIEESQPSSIFLKDEIKLRQLLGIEDVKIVNVPSDNEDIIHDRLGAATANYLTNILKSGSEVGIGCGKTLQCFSEKIKYTNKIKDVWFYPLVGGMSTNEDASLSSNKLCEKIADNFPRSMVQYLYAPIIASDMLTARAFLNSKPITDLFEKVQSIDIAVVGIDCDPDHSIMLKKAMLSDIESFSKSDLEELKNQNAVGSICAHFFNKDGKICNTSAGKRTIAIDPATFKSIPAVIAAAGGKYKTDAIIGAARGRLFNILITDIYTVHNIFDRLKNESGI